MTVFFTNEPTRNHPRHARTMAGPEGGHEKKGRETSEKDLHVYWDIEGCRVSLRPQDSTKTVEAITKSMKNAFQKDHGGREPKNIRIMAYVQTSWASKFQNQAMLQEIQQAGVQLVLVANPHNKPQVADIQIMRDIFQYLQSRRGGEAAVGLIAADGDFAGHLAVLKSSKVSTYVITSAKGGSRSCLHQFNVIGEWPLDTAKDVFECQQPPMKQHSPVGRSIFSRKSYTQRKECFPVSVNPGPQLTVKNNFEIEGQIATTGPMYGFIKAEVPIQFRTSSARIAPYGADLNPGTVVSLSFSMDANGVLFTKYINVVAEGTDQQGVGKKSSYSRGVVKRVGETHNPSTGLIIAEVFIYYKTEMLPKASIGDLVKVDAKFVTVGRLSAVKVNPLATNPSSAKKQRKEEKHQQSGAFSFFSSMFNIFGTPESSPSPVSSLPCSSGGNSPKKMGRRISPRQGRRPGRKARAHTASRTPSPKMTTKQNALPTRVPGKVKMVEGPFAIAEIHGGKIVHFSADHCTHQNPQIGDVVLVSYHNGDGKTADDDLIIASNVQKIITSYGNIRKIGPSCGLIKIPSVKRDVFFRRETLHECSQPVNGASVLVSYVHHRNGNLEAMHVRGRQ
mmetsp:Transcript_21359/g.34473  ORF Transcript_21359/g.34473 Transcript_21359/m.34473 type:complete len:619 (-) Transcript_21359:198-2054(-)